MGVSTVTNTASMRSSTRGLFTFKTHRLAEASSTSNKPKLSGLAVRWLAITPRLKSSRGAVVLFILQIEGVEDQQLFLDVINTPVAAPGVSLLVHIVDIHDVKIACAKEFFGFRIAESLGFRRRCGLLLDLQLC